MTTPATLGPAVKWIGSDSGFKTGVRVLLPDGEPLVCERVHEAPQIRYIMPPQDSGLLSRFMPPCGLYTERLCLVKEHHCGTLTWVAESALQPWPKYQPEPGEGT